MASELPSVFTDTVIDETETGQKNGVPSSYALPPNYFDRNAKPILVSRKPKDFLTGNKYKTKVFNIDIFIMERSLKFSNTYLNPGPRRERRDR